MAGRWWKLQGLCFAHYLGCGKQWYGHPIVYVTGRHRDEKNIQHKYTLHMYGSRSPPFIGRISVTVYLPPSSRTYQLPPPNTGPTSNVERTPPSRFFLMNYYYYHTGPFSGVDPPMQSTSKLAYISQLKPHMGMGDPCGVVVRGGLEIERLSVQIRPAASWRISSSGRISAIPLSFTLKVYQSLCQSSHFVYTVLALKEPCFGESVIPVSPFLSYHQIDFPSPFLGWP